MSTLISQVEMGISRMAAVGLPPNTIGVNPANAEDPNVKSAADIYALEIVADADCPFGEHYLSYRPLKLERGDQVVYIPNHAHHNARHPACEFGFVTSVKISEEAAAKIRDKAALLDASPILCIAVETDRARLVFNGMDNCGVGKNIAFCRFFTERGSDQLRTTANSESVEYLYLRKYVAHDQGFIDRLLENLDGDPQTLGRADE